MDNQFRERMRAQFGHGGHGGDDGPPLPGAGYPGEVQDALHDEPPPTPAPPIEPPIAVAADRPAGVPEQAEAAPAPMSVVLFGISGHGKSMFEASIYQASIQQGQEPWLQDDPGELNGPPYRFVVTPRGEEAQRMHQQALDVLTQRGRAFQATDQPEVHRYGVTVTEQGSTWRPPTALSAELEFRDGPGGGLVPSEEEERQGQDGPLEWEQALLEAGRDAEALALCVDPLTPQRNRLARRMPRLIGEFATERPARQQVLTVRHRIMRMLGLARDAGSGQRREIRLNCERFLLVLTKADLLVTHHFDRAEARVRPGARPVDIARRIDPVRVAWRELGGTLLNQIRFHLPKDAQFAVALTSAWGFDPRTGRPLMDVDGAEPHLQAGEDRAELYKYWLPFGVREASLFLVAGRLEGPVALVTEESIAAASQLEPLR